MLERTLENPTVVTLEKIARALGVDIVDVVADVPASSARPPTLPPGPKRQS
jgi:hypothetical protein